VVKWRTDTEPVGAAADGEDKEKRMAHLGSRGQKWLKCLHVFTACLWVGGTLTLFLMMFVMRGGDGAVVYGEDLAFKFVDDFVVIPGAIGLLATGIVYSVFTKWGWFRHTWIVVKWCVNLFGVILGTFWLGPWTNSLPVISQTEGVKALSNPVYLHNLEMMRIWGSILAATITFALLISTLKPWKRKGSRSA
jgi:hypothetical protein